MDIQNFIALLPIILPFFLGSISSTHTSKKETIISARGTTYESYRATCSAPDVRDHDVYTSVMEAMRKEGVTSVWLPIRRRDLGGWFWLGGAPHKLESTARGLTSLGWDCAILWSEVALIDQVPCNNIYSYHICEILDSYKHGHIVNDSVGLLLKGYKLVLVRGNMNWYQAKESCHQRGYRLATLPSAQLQSISVALKEKLGEHDKFWIGLRQKDYFYDLEQKNDISVQHWDSSRLCPCLEKKCAILKMRYQSKFFWGQENCNETHRYACTIIPFKQTAGFDKNSNPDEGDVLFPVVPVAVPAVCAVVLVALALGIYCYLAKRRKGDKKDVASDVKRGENQDESQHSENAEANPLLVPNVGEEAHEPRTAEERQERLPQKSRKDADKQSNFRKETREGVPNTANMQQQLPQQNTVSLPEQIDDGKQNNSDGDGYPSMDQTDGQSRPVVYKETCNSSERQPHLELKHQDDTKKYFNNLNTSSPPSFQEVIVSPPGNEKLLTKLQVDDAVATPTNSQPSPSGHTTRAAPLNSSLGSASYVPSYPSVQSETDTRKPSYQIASEVGSVPVSGNPPVLTENVNNARPPSSWMDVRTKAVSHMSFSTGAPTGTAGLSLGTSTILGIRTAKSVLRR